MVSRFLITTADERTWPKDQPVLFLGEWCRLYNRKDVWQNMDAEVVPYHWDDRRKLHRDYLYLEGLYEELLQELTERLNSIHGVEHSLRYWRILVGLWLGYFMQMLFDRWTMIDNALNNYSITGVRVLTTSPEQIIPNDIKHFNRLFWADSWNEAICGQLLQCFTSIPVEKVSIEKLCSAEVPEPAPVSPPVLPFAQRLKRNLAHVKSHVLQRLARKDESFLLNTYLPTEYDSHLQKCLGQVPKSWTLLDTPKTKVDLTRRQWQLGDKKMDGFQAIVRAMIPTHIPALYLEGYSALNACCAALPWPRMPRLIFTSNAHSSEDIFKAWAAAKAEDGVPLVMGQHGGTYGTALWNFTEDHQCEISDAMLSWGWEDGTNNKIKPVCNLKMVGRRLRWDPDGGALMVEMALPRYSYHMYSVPVAGQWLDYFDEQIRFVAALPKDLRGQLLVRLYSSDFGRCQRQRWQDNFPQIRLDDGIVPIEPLIEKSRLYISTYNSTTFLESLSINIPTIMFWKPKHWELRESARFYYERLKFVGIMHETPESAAAKVAEIWDDVAGWWQQPNIQETRQYFCDRFSRTVDEPIKIIKETLTAVVSRNACNKIC